MEMRTNPDFNTFLCKFFTFLNACISVKTSPINTKLGDFVSLGVLFLTMWINSRCTCKSQLNSKADCEVILCVHNTTNIISKGFTITNSVVHFLDFAGSVGKSADSAFLSASVDDPDDAFVGFTYVPPTDLTE